MEDVCLKILKERPQLNKKVILIIEPLAPLSMVSDLPGSFYKSILSPSKKMICGLFENLLGWHFSWKDRTLIQKELIKLRKKQKLEFEKPQSGSTFIPLLMEYFEIELITVPSVLHYNDLWSRAYRRADAVNHPNGTINISYDLIPIKRNKPRDKKKPKQIKTKELEILFKNNDGKFPMYYTIPTNREYIKYDERIELDLKIDYELAQKLVNKIQYNNYLYLGNSEGWINLKFESYGN